MVSAQGGLSRGGGYLSTGWGCRPPPCGQTDTCENITFPQLLLRTVNITEGDPGSFMEGGGDYSPMIFPDFMKTS